MVILASLLFLSFTLAVSLMHTSLMKPLRRLRWFEINSLKFAFFAAAWALIILLLSSFFGVRHVGFKVVALAPILIVLLSMFLLTIMHIPNVWYNSFKSFLDYFRSDRREL